MQTSAPVPPRSHHHRQQKANIPGVRSPEESRPERTTDTKNTPTPPTPGTPHLPEPKTTGRRSGTPPLLPSSRGRPAPARRRRPSRLLRQAPCRTRTGQPGPPRGRGNKRTKPHATQKVFHSGDECVAGRKIRRCRRCPLVVLRFATLASHSIGRLRLSLARYYLRFSGVFS